VLRLIREARLDLADASTLYYLEELDSCDRSAIGTQNTIRFWAAVLQQNRAILPKAGRSSRKLFQKCT
jgi:hypothetical protein